MTFSSNRKGSALLIVLGMMAFIIVSAVAFSAYMRAARMPSSYLRRSSSSRLLVKAALAEAIEEIDAAIGNNPHPGVGTRQFRHPRESGDLINRNLWAEHVYIGCTNNSGGTVDQNLVSPSETVSTLCVEALAYIPPPLINEARYYSRRSTAARWHDMGFDSGRYAFCAIDVSDCLDINRVTAGSGLNGGSNLREIPAGRNSSDTGRITLAHVFENSSHNGYQSTVTPADWDKFMDDYLTEDGRADSSKVPLVSVADMNLAIRQNLKQAANDMSPFCRVFENGGDFVQSEDDFHRSTMFVTDSVMAATNAVGGTFDLSNPAHQPFYGFPDDKPDTNDATFDKLMQQSNGFLDKYQNELSAPEVAQLYDYLDLDSVPVTLAMPTVERTPMVVAMSLEGQLGMSVEKTDLPEKQVNENERYRGTAYTLKFSGDLTAAVGSVFPFKYKRGSTKPFKAQAAATITLVPCGGAGYKSLRLPSSVAPAVFLRDGWGSGEQQAAAASYPGKTLPSVITVRSREMSLNMPGDGVKQESEAAIDDILLPLRVDNVPFGSELPENGTFAQKSVCTMRVAQKQVRTVVDGMVTWQDAAEPPVVEFGALPSNGDLSAALDPSDSAKYAPVVQVWARIVDENNRAVDLVPACTADDENPSQLLNGERGCGPRPVLRFWDGNPDAVAEPQSAVAFTEAGLGAYGTKSVQTWPKGWLADDPRFNHAPENMIAVEDVGSEFSKMWLEKQRSADDNRDGDIFMSVSDAGYMQSKYELANLLRITGFDGGGDGFGSSSGSAYNGAIRKSFEATAANGSMWRTYSQYAAGSGSDDIASKFSSVTGGSKGFRINPYTRSKDVMMTALANSPLDWWAASTNDAVDEVKKTQLSSIAESDKYTFSEHSGAQVQLKHERLEELAEYMQARFGGSDSVDQWQSLFDGMGWDYLESEREIGGKDLGVPLHTVDRKFLHGFWRECFDTRQQLFLVFVRAEPMMMGGGVVGQMPPQLGARAVALVWRDPTATAEDAGTSSQPRPHRSRILFYRQFD